MTVFEIIQRHSDELLRGLGVTLALCLVVWSASFVLGTLLGVFSAKFPVWIGIPQRITSLLLAGVPAIVFLFWLYYPAQALFNVVVSPFVTASVAISILGIFMVADTVRSVLDHFPKQYEVAGKVCGLSDFQILVHIKSRIIVRYVFPQLLLIMITLFQMTLFASFISVDEIFRVAQRINSVTYRPIEVFTALAVFCILVCVPINMTANYLGKRYLRDISER